MTWFVLDRVGLELEALGALDPAVWVPDPVLLVVASLLLLAGYLWSAALWGMIVSDLGGPRLPATEAVRLFMIANLGRYVPGKLWQIAGLAVLARGRGVSAPTATGAAVLGQGIALAAATMVGLGALVDAGPSVRRWGLAAAGAVVVGVALSAVPAVSRRLAALWFRVARREAPEGLSSVHGLRWLFLYGLNWVLYAFSFWVLVRSLGLSGEVVPVASAFAAAYVLGYLMIFAPAGIGVREGFLVAFLTPHLGVAPSGAVAVIARVWTTLVEVVPAAAFWARHVAGSDPASDSTQEHTGE